MKELNELNMRLTWTANESAASFVEYFVLYMDNVNKISAKLDDLTSKNGDVSQLYLLIMEYKIKMTENGKNKIQDVGQ